MHVVVICAGPGLVFVVYPAAIARMPGSPVWAALFFVFLFTVGVDSQVLYCTLMHSYSDPSSCLQCFDAVGWAAGRASGL